MERFLERMRDVQHRNMIAMQGVMVEQPLERAAQNIHLAIADFVVEILRTKSSHDAREIWKMLVQLTLALEATESAALNRAEALQKDGR